MTMGRPKAVNIKTFPLYDKLHTEKTEMYLGVNITTLYPVKETEHFYTSIEVWAYCSHKFKAKKKNFQLSVNIPTIKDDKTAVFLKEHCWEDWINTEHKNSDMTETTQLLKRIFPNHQLSYFYELDSIISAYNFGTFTKSTEEALKKRKYYSGKYLNYLESTVEINTANREYQEAVINKVGEDEIQKLYDVYHRLREDYNYKTNCLDSVFLNIGENSVCYPVAFTHNTAEWSREKNGKLIAYAHAGEIYFVATHDTVYFEIKRHY